MKAAGDGGCKMAQGQEGMWRLPVNFYGCKGESMLYFSISADMSLQEKEDVGNALDGYKSAHFGAVSKPDKQADRALVKRCAPHARIGAG